MLRKHNLHPLFCSVYFQGVTGTTEENGEGKTGMTAGHVPGQYIKYLFFVDKMTFDVS